MSRIPSESVGFRTGNMRCRLQRIAPAGSLLTVEFFPRVMGMQTLCVDTADVATVDLLTPYECVFTAEDSPTMAALLAVAHLRPFVARAPGTPPKAQFRQSLSGRKAGTD